MKVSIIGVGRVGSTLAFTLTLRQVASEIVLVGRDLKKVRGDALDLQQSIFFRDAPLTVTAGDVDATEGSDILAFCASHPKDASIKTRMDFGAANTRLIAQLLPPLAAASPHARLLMLTNPVDVLTYHAISLTGFEPGRVIGAGTLVDSARFRYLLSEQAGIHPMDVRAYILGEHGDSQVPSISSATAGGEPMEDTPHRRALFQEAMQSGDEVYFAKGYTNYAIATGTAYLIETIADDSKRTMPVSTLIDGYYDVSDVCLSLPVVIGKSGVERILKPSLNEEETRQFRHSAELVRNAIDATRSLASGKTSSS